MVFYEVRNVLCVSLGSRTGSLCIPYNVLMVSHGSVLICYGFLLISKGALLISIDFPWRPMDFFYGGCAARSDQAASASSRAT